MVSHEKGFTRPTSMIYSVAYKPITMPNGPGHVVVSVEEFPNSDWARYLLDYPQNIVAHFDDPGHHALITKFQNRVRTNALERGPVLTAFPLYYMWVSANDLITIRYNGSVEDDAFLREYLQKYPSSTK